MKIRNAILTVAMVAGVILAAKFLFSSEESKVLKRFAEMSAAISKNSEEPILTAIAKSKALGKFFTSPCNISTPYSELSGTFTTDDIAGIALQARARCSDLSVNFADIKVAFPSSGTANATLTIKVNASGSGEKMSDVREFTATLRKDDRKWLFSDFTMVAVMKK